MITQQEALHLFEYKDGALYWKESPSFNVEAGAKAGRPNRRDGRLQVTVNRKLYYVHRIVFLMHHGHLPRMIDHANSDCTDNRIENLRQCDDAENNFNSSLRKDNKSGVKGIYWKAKEQKWCALISTRGKRKHVGYFKELNDAIAALTAVRSELHKEFANHG